MDICVLPSVSKNGMFHIMRNSENFETADLKTMLYTEQDLLQGLAMLFKKRFPDTWDISLEPIQVPERFQADAMLVIRAPDGVSGRILVEAKSVGSVGIYYWLARYAQLLSKQDFPMSQWLLVASYVSPMVQQRLKEVGVSYVDMTGKLYFTCDH